MFLDNEQTRIVQRLLGETRTQQGFPGIACAIVHNQECIFELTHGDAAGYEPVTNKTRFAIASLSKLYTAHAIMHARDTEDIGHLDEPLTNYSWFGNPQNPFSDPKGITFRQVLSHTSGLPRELPGNHWQDGNFPYADTLRHNPKANINNTKLLSRPGSVYTYSNLGYSLLGSVLEKITQKDLATYLHIHFAFPLNINFTQGPTARGHIIQDSIVKPAIPFEANAYLPALGFSASIVELTRFLQFQFRDEAKGKGQPLGIQTLTEMRQVQALIDNENAMCIGWKYNIPSGLHVHGGSIFGFQAAIAMDMKQKIGVAFLANGTTTNSFSPVSLAQQLVELTKSFQPEDEEYIDENVASPYLGTYRHEQLGKEVTLFLRNGKLFIKGEINGKLHLTEDQENITFRIDSTRQFKNQIIRFQVDEQGKIMGADIGGFVAKRIH